jgi:hypothetical protein
MSSFFKGTILPSAVYDHMDGCAAAGTTTTFAMYFFEHYNKKEWPPLDFNHLRDVHATALIAKLTGVP